MSPLHHGVLLISLLKAVKLNGVCLLMCYRQQPEHYGVGLWEAVIGTELPVNTATSQLNLNLRFYLCHTVMHQSTDGSEAKVQTLLYSRLYSI